MVLTRRWKVNVSIEPSVISDIRMFALIISRLSDEIFLTLELCSFESQVPIHIWFLYVYFFDLNALVETSNSRQMPTYRRKKSRPLSIHVPWFYILLVRKIEITISIYIWNYSYFIYRLFHWRGNASFTFSTWFRIIFVWKIRSMKLDALCVWVCSTMVLTDFTLMTANS